MERNVIDEFVHSLRLPRRRRQAITRELQGHLEESRRELELAGWQPDQAARESVHRLGNPHEIAEAFVQVYRTPRRTQIGLAVALATGMLLGVWGIGGSLASATSTPGKTHPTSHVRVVTSPQHCTHAHRKPRR